MRLPLRYSSFQAIPEQLREGAWIEIRDNCRLPDSAEKVVMGDLKDVWCHWKCIIKSTYFAPHQNDDEALKKVPTDRIVAEEWPLLVQYWKDEKDIARRNTNNSIKRKFPHRTGRKPFTTLADEIKATGKEPDNLEIWMSSRTKRRGGDDEMTDDILCSSLTDGRSLTPGTNVLNPLTIGSRILLISRGLEKHVVGEGVLLSDPTPGDTVDIVRVFVTTATVPEAELILRTTSGAQTLGEVVRGEPIDWTFKDFVCRP
ncbi:uncharacterized protein LOC127256598 isoform X2 [Andrographis paniculata]|uniref:uncharacterized protein LOC127256598 isoform X2 n=1 Tax=Andrographis paniculata TaxID=175694 RepID=UPI0021E7F391|nr:uncharacterized protein LOC127256598 isoform X2 [Andrographis paniculata]